MASRLVASTAQLYPPTGNCTAPLLVPWWRPGWLAMLRGMSSNNAAAAGPKMAALIAAAAEPSPEIPFVTLHSKGAALIYGSDARAVEAGEQLKAHLDITVLITPPAAAVPPRS